MTAALDFLAGRNDLDLGRVGLAGVWLGGYYAPRAAAYETRVKAAVGISGPSTSPRLGDDAGLDARDRPAPCRRGGRGGGPREGGQAGPLRAAPRLDRPYLAITGRHDRLIPWGGHEREADEAPGGEFVLFDDGNHVCNNLPYLYRPLTADWLREKLA